MNKNKSLKQKNATAKLFTACEDGNEYDLEQLTSMFTSSNALHGLILSNKFLRKLLLNWSEAAISKIIINAAILPFFPPLNIKIDHKIIYAIEGDSIWVLAVAHASRKPEYWKDRKQSFK